mmetsp:Transcript_11725/g.35168  ORF Transcript_11725/g.35168 Transcript_11725/m.35168 type:complete len:84 (+) Transcript_11725:161-412(+)
MSFSAKRARNGSDTGGTPWHRHAGLRGGAHGAGPPVVLDAGLAARYVPRDSTAAAQTLPKSGLHLRGPDRRLSDSRATPPANQ